MWFLNQTKSAVKKTCSILNNIAYSVGARVTWLAEMDIPTWDSEKSNTYNVANAAVTFCVDALKTNIISLPGFEWIMLGMLAAETAKTTLDAVITAIIPNAKNHWGIRLASEITYGLVSTYAQGSSMMTYAPQAVSSSLFRIANETLLIQSGLEAQLAQKLAMLMSHYEMQIGIRSFQKLFFPTVTFVHATPGVTYIHRCEEDGWTNIFLGQPTPSCTFEEHNHSDQNFYLNGRLIETFSASAIYQHSKNGLMLQRQKVSFINGGTRYTKTVDFTNPSHPKVSEWIESLQKQTLQVQTYVSSETCLPWNYALTHAALSYVLAHIGGYRSFAAISAISSGLTALFPTANAEIVPTQVISKQSAYVGVPFKFTIDPNHIFNNSGANVVISEILLNGASLPQWLKTFLSPAFVANYSGGIDYNIALQGNTAFLSDESNGLLILNIEDPVSPTLLSNYPSGTGQTEACAIQESYAFIAGCNQLEIINIANLTAPAPVSIYPLNATLGCLWGIGIDGQYAYLAANKAGIQIVDISNITSPLLAASIPADGGYGETAVVRDNYLFVSDANELQIVNVTEPSMPNIVGRYQDGTSGKINHVALRGNYAFLAHEESGVKILNISNVSNPFLVSNYSTSPGDTAWQVFIQNSYLFVAATNALEILDVSDITSPQLVAQYPAAPGGFVHRVVAKGNYLYVAEENAGLQILTVGNRTLKGVPSFLDLGSYDLQVIGNDDQGNNVSATFALTVVSSLCAENLNQQITYLEGLPQGLLPITLTSLASNTTAVNFSMADPSAGRLNTSFIGNISSLYNLSTGLWQVTGNIFDVNSLLANITFIPTRDTQKMVPVLVNVTDFINLPLSGTIELVPSLPPYILNPLRNQTALIGVPFQYSIPNDTFVGIDGNPVLEIPTNLPSWLQFINQTFFGLPFGINAGENEIVIIAYNQFGQNTSDRFSLFVLPSLWASGLNQTLIYRENIPLYLPPILIEDPVKSVFVNFTLCSPNSGMLSSTAEINQSRFIMSATLERLDYFGTIDSINTLLANMLFTPTENNINNVSVKISIGDGYNFPRFGNVFLMGLPTHVPTVQIQNITSINNETIVLPLDPDIDLTSADGFITNATARITEGCVPSEDHLDLLPLPSNLTRPFSVQEPCALFMVACSYTGCEPRPPHRHRYWLDYLSMTENTTYLTTEDWNLILQRYVAYNNTAMDPSTGKRVITFTVSSETKAIVAEATIILDFQTAPQPNPITPNTTNPTAEDRYLSIILPAVLAPTIGLTGLAIILCLLKRHCVRNNKQAIGLFFKHKNAATQLREELLATARLDDAEHLHNKL